MLSVYCAVQRSCLEKLVPNGLITSCPHSVAFTDTIETAILSSSHYGIS